VSDKGAASGQFFELSARQTPHANAFYLGLDKLFEHDLTIGLGITVSWVHVGVPVPSFRELTCHATTLIEVTDSDELPALI
jgi:hypothetical protein